MQISVEIGKDEIEALTQARLAGQREARENWRPLVVHLTHALDAIIRDLTGIKSKPDLTVAGGD